MNMLNRIELLEKQVERINALIGFDNEDDEKCPNDIVCQGDENDFREEESYWVIQANPKARPGKSRKPAMYLTRCVNDEEWGSVSDLWDQWDGRVGDNDSAILLFPTKAKAMQTLKYLGEDEMLEGYSKPFVAERITGQQ